MRRLLFSLALAAVCAPAAPAAAQTRSPSQQMTERLFYKTPLGATRAGYLYVPPGDVGFWQGALRDPAEPGYAEMCEAVQEHRRLSVELLYGDHEGGQRVVSRFALTSGGNGSVWLSSVGRHWNLDRPDPR